MRQQYKMLSSARCARKLVCSSRKVYPEGTQISSAKPVRGFANSARLRGTKSEALPCYFAGKSAISCILDYFDREH